MNHRKSRKDINEKNKDTNQNIIPKPKLDIINNEEISKSF